jgi:soluble lytic murein transglycosylase-like protein
MPKILFHFMAILILAFACDMGHAEVYEYEDETGSIHFTNVPTDPQYKMIVPPKTSRSSREKNLQRKYQPEDFEKIIENHSIRYGMDPKLVDAVIRVESSYNPRAISMKGAQGLMQLMPETARELGVNDPFDPSQNIEGGVRYLRYLLDFFKWDLDLALAAYNAGINRVSHYKKIPPIKETQSYVKSVKRTYRQQISPSPAMEKPVRRMVADSGDIVFTNTPEAYLQ